MCFSHTHIDSPSLPLSRSFKKYSCKKLCHLLHLLDLQPSNPQPKIPVHDKELRKQLVAEMQFLKPALREDPCVHLVQIYDAYFSDDKTYIVLEFCSGGALDSCLQKHGPCSEPCLAVVVRQVRTRIHLWTALLEKLRLAPSW